MATTALLRSLSLFAIAAALLALVPPSAVLCLELNGEATLEIVCLHGHCGDGHAEDESEPGHEEPETAPSAGVEATHNLVECLDVARVFSVSEVDCDLAPAAEVAVQRPMWLSRVSRPRAANTPSPLAARPPPEPLQTTVLRI